MGEGMRGGEREGERERDGEGERERETERQREREREKHKITRHIYNVQPTYMYKHTYVPN